MIEEYRRSLKMPAAEELFDLLLYRPLAFLLVKGIYRLPVTPNQVTLLSLFSGLIAAWYFSAGTAAALAWGALWYGIANILDCADGQLARLQQSGTPLGRLVDGIADYVSTIAIFLGIGVGLAAAGIPQWPAVVLAGISSAVHAMFFDHYQSEYVSGDGAGRTFNSVETEKTASRLRNPGPKEQGKLKQFVLSIYLRYLAIQHRADAVGGRKPVDPQTYRRDNSSMIRYWSWLGPTTNRTVLIFLALLGRPDIYLWGIVIAGNLWLAACYLLQRRIHRRVEPGADVPGMGR